MKFLVVVDFTAVKSFTLEAKNYIEARKQLDKIPHDQLFARVGGLENEDIIEAQGWIEIDSEEK